MFSLRRIAIVLVLGLAAWSAAAQTTLSGVATSDAGAALASGSVVFQLENCVSTPTSNSSYSFTLSSSGALSGTVAPNTSAATGCTGTSYYQVSASDSTGTLQWRRNYTITGTSWNIATAQQMTSIPSSGEQGPPGGLPGATDVSTLSGGDFGAKLTTCISGLNTTYGGICEGRNMGQSQTISANITISTPNAVINLPCGTITTAYQLIVSPGTRNVSIHGCSYEGGSTASGTQGGTVWVYTGASIGLQVGDMTFQVNTPGFHIDNINFNTASAASGAMAFAFYRTQELSVENVYLNGNNALTLTSGSGPQYGIYLNGSGNYSGGNFDNVYINGFGEGLVLDGGADNIGDYSNASTFKKLHIVCPSGGTSTQPTYGIDIRAGDGNEFVGGDIESCYTMLHLGSKAIDNTFDGVRNENSTYQIVADSGSGYNQWKSGGTLFIGQLVDDGEHNSFEDAFHRTQNGMNGDWYASQQDATVTNHYRLGIGAGNERGLLDRYQTDYGYRWTVGISDATGGAQSYQIYDEINGIYRLSIGQYTAPVAGEVTAVVIQHGGSYSSSTPPTVSFTGGGGTGAAITPVMEQESNGTWTVSGFTGLVPGSGYTSVPTLVFTGSNQITAPTASVEVAIVGSTNNQTLLNSAGTGSICFNCSANSGTGGIVFSSGGATPTTAATIDNAGDEVLNGTLYVNGTGESTFTGTLRVMNVQNAEVDYILQAGLTASQKESLVFKDYNGNSQWYAEKDQNNNWELNSATGGLDSFKAYQSTNSGDTYINASNSSGVIRLNYETGSGTAVKIYGGGSNNLYAAFTGTTSIQFPGLAAGSGHSCLQIDNSGYITNTGTACGTGNGNGNGTVTQVAMTVPADESVSGSPITGSGTFAVTRNAQAANLFLAGPCSGTAATPLYRILCAADLPAATSSAQGAVELPSGASSNQLGTAAMQPTTSFDAAGAASTAQSNAETFSANASNINSGTLPHAQLPSLVSSDITAALGFTPYNATNPSGYITSSALSPYALTSSLGTAAYQPSTAFDAAGAASSAQSTAESYASNASNLASGTVPAGRLPAATSSAQGAVQLPSGASGNTLGTAAMQPTTAFDGAGAATTAQSNAEAYSSNASNLNSGTVPAAQLPAATSSARGAVQLPSGMSGSTLGPAVAAGNTLGCLDGWDHLPCVVYEMGLTSESAATGSYATAYTTPAAGVYRITGNIYATTDSSTAYSVTLQVKEGQTSSVTSHGLGVDSATIGTSDSWNQMTPVQQNLSSGVNIQWETVTGSGSNTGGVWNIDLVIERVK